MPTGEWIDDVWGGILAMRKDRNAPVDTMGCDKLGDFGLNDPKCRRFCHLVACFLSSKTTDQATAACMHRLNEANLLSPEKIVHVDQETLASYLKGVAFYNQKAKNLIAISKILLTEYNGDIPRELTGLCDLPGIGLKMGLLTLAAAWGEVVGIAVDTHVHRISNRIGIVHTKTPDQTAEALKAVVPVEHWPDYNNILVGFGQQRCTPANPKCHACIIKQLCEYGRKYRTNEKSPEKRRKLN